MLDPEAKSRASAALDRLEDGLVALGGLGHLVGENSELPGGMAGQLSMLLHFVHRECEQSFQELHQLIRNRS